MTQKQARPVLSLLENRLVPAIVIVHLFDDDYSTNAPPGPIVDPTINAGDTVRWVWNTLNFSEHSTTSAAGQAESWNSGLQNPPFQFDHTFTKLGAFNYYCTLHGADVGGGQVLGMSGKITVVTPPPKITEVIINAGAMQRSRVSETKVVFDQVVNLPADPTEAFTLIRQGNDAKVMLAAAVTNPGHTEVVLTFTDGSIDSGPGFNAPFSLTDGRYTLTALSSKISNANGALDGDSNGTAGGDYVLSPGTNPTPINIFRIFGDGDGNGSVTPTDFALFRAAFGQGMSIFDYQNNAETGSSDFAEFRRRFGVTI